MFAVAIITVSIPMCFISMNASFIIIHLYDQLVVSSAFCCFRENHYRSTYAKSPLSTVIPTVPENAGVVKEGSQQKYGLGSKLRREKSLLVRRLSQSSQSPRRGARKKRKIKVAHG